MLTISALLLAFLVLPAPWSWIAPVGALTVDVIEVWAFRSWSKRRKPLVGVETLAGRSAVAVTRLAPLGFVRIDGELWEASAEVTVEAGHEVSIREVDGLLLLVVAAGRNAS